MNHSKCNDISHRKHLFEWHKCVGMKMTIKLSINKIRIVIYRLPYFFQIISNGLPLSACSLTMNIETLI